MAARRRCEFCDDLLPKGSRADRKFCSDDCRRGRVRQPMVVDSGDVLRALRSVGEERGELGEVEGALEEAIVQAREEKRIGVMDAGALAAVRVLARKIDEEQARWDYCFEWAERWTEWSRAEGDLDDGPPPQPPKPPPMDNVSLPTFLRYCESLGLTPAGRGRIPGGPAKEGGGGGKLSGLVGGIPRPA